MSKLLEELAHRAKSASGALMAELHALFCRGDAPEHDDAARLEEIVKELRLSREQILEFETWSKQFNRGKFAMAGIAEVPAMLARAAQLDDQSKAIGAEILALRESQEPSLKEEAELRDRCRMLENRREDLHRIVLLHADYLAGPWAELEKEIKDAEAASGE